MFRSETPCEYEWADTLPCPPPCGHHVLSRDGQVCLACNEDLTLEMHAGTLRAPVVDP